MLALLSRASEEATFAFEASQSPLVVRPLAWNPNQAITRVDVEVHDDVQVDISREESIAVSEDGGRAWGARAPRILYAKEKKGGEADWHELAARGV